MYQSHPQLHLMVRSFGWAWRRRFRDFGFLAVIYFGCGVGIEVDVDWKQVRLQVSVLDS